MQVPAIEARGDTGRQPPLLPRVFAGNRLTRSLPPSGVSLVTASLQRVKPSSNIKPTFML